MRASLCTDTLCSGKDKHKILGFQTCRHIHRKKILQNSDVAESREWLIMEGWTRKTHRGKLGAVCKGWKGRTFQIEGTAYPASTKTQSSRYDRSTI